MLGAASLQSNECGRMSEASVGSSGLDCPIRETDLTSYTLSML
jgi:hypothetical protein